MIEVDGEQLQPTMKEYGSLALLSPTPYGRNDQSLDNFDIRERINNTTVINDSMEQIRPLTPPKELFYDHKYDI